jgi:hypothetical protein
MSAGQPNWQKLHEMGKLPKDQRSKIPALIQLDTVEAKIEKIKVGVCDDCREKFFPGEKATKDVGGAIAKCEVDGCNFVAEGKLKVNAVNTLRKHVTEVHTPELKQ